MLLSDRILFIDGEAMVLDKPAGLPVDTPRRGGESIASRLGELRCGFPRPPGGKTITSYLERRSAVAPTFWVLVYSYGTCSRSNSSRHQPSLCALCHVCMIAIFGARTKWVFTVGAAATAYACTPSSAPAFDNSAPATSLSPVSACAAGIPLPLMGRG